MKTPFFISHPSNPRPSSSLLLTPSLLDLRLFSDISENAAVNIEDMAVHGIRGV
jgi:hypothetical protein